MELENIKNLKERVRYCLRKYPHTRNSDVKLTLAIWWEFYDLKDEFPITSLKDLTNLMLECPREDNVKRVRAEIQNVDGDFLPTEWTIAKQRGINEQVWRKYYGGTEYQFNGVGICDLPSEKEQGRLFEPGRVQNA